VDMGTWYWYHTARTKEQQTTKEPGKDRETKRKKEKVKKEEVNFFHFFFILFKKCYDKCLNALRVLSRECALYSTVFVVAGVVLALYCTATEYMCSLYAITLTCIALSYSIMLSLSSTYHTVSCIITFVTMYGMVPCNMMMMINCILYFERVQFQFQYSIFHL